MKIRCPHCHRFVEYNPQDRQILKRKRCTECRRWFQVTEQDVVSEERSQITIDRNRYLIKSICDWMEDGHQISSWSEIKTEFNLSAARTSRILKRMTEYELIKQLPDRKFALFNLSSLELIETEDELPQYCDWHFIKIRSEILHRESDLNILQNLNRLGIRYNRVEMRGNWVKIFVYSRLSQWDCIEINKETVFLNYRGIIRTHNPVATVEDIESHDLISAVQFLHSIGITIANRIADVSGHWALIGQKLTRAQIALYEHIWSDQSTGIPEIETDSLQVAQNLIEVIKTINKVEDYLKFRFFNRDRHVFFKLKQQFQRKLLSFMEFIERVQQIGTYQLFRAAANFRVQLQQPQVIT